MEDILAIIFLFGGGTAVLLAFSPVGRALAERIRGRLSGPDPEVLGELDQLRQDVIELNERLDFTERLVTQQRENARLEGEKAP